MERKVDNLLRYVKELEKMFNATIMLQTGYRENFDTMLESVPIMKELRRLAL